MQYVAFVEPGNVITRQRRPAGAAATQLGAPPARLPQMPAYHLVRADWQRHHAW